MSDHAAYHRAVAEAERTLFQEQPGLKNYATGGGAKVEDHSNRVFKPTYIEKLDVHVPKWFLGVLTAFLAGLLCYLFLGKITINFLW